MTRWFGFVTGFDSMNGLAVGLSDWALRGTVVLALAAAVTWTLRGRSAAVRHWVWTASLVSLLALPVVARVAPGWELPGVSLWNMGQPTLEATQEPQEASSAGRVMNGQALTERYGVGARCGERTVTSGIAPLTDSLSGNATGASVSDVNVASTYLGATTNIPVATTASAFEAGSAVELSWSESLALAARSSGQAAMRWLPFVWMTGLLAMLVPVAGGVVSLARLKRMSQPLPSDLETELLALTRTLGIQRPIVAMLSESRGIPMTWGLFRPKLLFPVDATSWEVERRRMVLLHELAHIARGDFQTQLVGQVVRALHWFNPLAWYALSRLRLEQERACDDIVLNAGAVAEDYAAELLCVTSRRPRAAWDFALALAMSQSARLEDRLTAILDSRRDRRPVTGKRRDLIAALSLVGLAVVASAGRVSGDGSNAVAMPERPAVPAVVQQFAEQTNSDASRMAAVASTVPAAASSLGGIGLPGVILMAQAELQKDVSGNQTAPAVRPDDKAADSNGWDNLLTKLHQCADCHAGKQADVIDKAWQKGNPVQKHFRDWKADDGKNRPHNVAAFHKCTECHQARNKEPLGLLNADFEGESDSEGHPAGWFALILPATKDFVEFKHSDGGREVAGRAGKKCAMLAIKADHPDTGIHYNWLTELKGWEPGKNYVVSAWVKVSNVSNGPFIVVETLDENSHPLSIHTSEIDGAEKPINPNGKINGTRDWTKLTATFRVAPTAKRVYVRLALPSIGNRAGSVGFDDVTVEPTDADVPATHLPVPPVPKIVGVPNPTLDLVRAKIEAFSAKPVDPKALTEGAVKGMLEALKDEYSTVLTAEQLAGLTGHMSLVGIGVQIAKVKEGDDPEKVVVLRAFANSPAAKAGLKPQDQLLAIDDKAITSLEMAVNGIRGVAGSSVKLKLRRADNSVADVTVVREVVSNLVEPVTGLAQDDASQWRYWLDANAKIGYVHLTQFTGTTAPQLEAVVKGLQAEGLTGLVLDLRGNMGGLLSDCVNTASLFVKAGQVVRYQERAKEEQSLGVSGKVAFADLPLVVVVDGTTASAAEVLAGALLDHGRAVLVGDRTFGKGSIQSIHPLGEGGAAIKLTTAYLLTPSGRSINRSPDAKSWGIDPSDGWFVPSKEEDRQARQHRVLTGGKLPPVVTPESVETALRDKPLAAAWKAMTGKLTTGDFAKTGLRLNDQQQQLARRDELVRQRDELKNKLLVLEKELGQ